ncbi:MAG: tryptophan--tRNA ligase [Candidatus Gracilibacteria bacterium]|nr:tryptophan--tRNA ligase [Candidatus Gracilibacteria bacterium]
MKKILTGVKPTGDQMHLGNLLGAVLPFKRLAEKNDAAIFIADLHALTSVKNAADLKRNTHEMALTYFSIFGIDTPVHIFRQSDIPLIPKLNWILNNVTPYSLMLRAHSFKDALQKQKILEKSLFPKIVFDMEKKCLKAGISDKAIIFEKTQEAYDNLYGNAPNLNMGIFNYPILMAADILAYDTDIVPVGADQKQHLEMTRDIAKAFNKTYKTDIFKLPSEYIEKDVSILPGIDGRKMSKSYDNFIGIFDDDKTLKKKVMSIVTDSKGFDDIKDPETCNVFALIKTFATPDRTESIRAKYLVPGYGYGHAKLELLEILTEYLRPYHDARAMLEKHPELIEQKLQEGARIMNERIEAKMEEVKEVVGL